MAYEFSNIICIILMMSNITCSGKLFIVLNANYIQFSRFCIEFLLTKPTASFWCRKWTGVVFIPCKGVRGTHVACACSHFVQGSWCYVLSHQVLSRRSDNYLLPRQNNRHIDPYKSSWNASNPHPFCHHYPDIVNKKPPASADERHWHYPHKSSSISRRQPPTAASKIVCRPKTSSICPENTWSWSPD